MDKLRLINYRCFEDTGAIDIKPITVLIGANSSGKSSFLKTFPLLKQSIGEMVNGAFLWAGPLVDLKDFSNTVRSGQDEMVIEYTINSLPLNRTAPIRGSVLRNVKVEIHLAKRDMMFDYIKGLKITTKGIEVNVSYNPDLTAKLTYNTVSSVDYQENVYWGINNSLIPKLFFTTNRKRESLDEYSDIVRDALMETFKKMGMEEDNWRWFLSYFRKNVFDRNEINRALAKYDKGGNMVSQYEHISDLIQYYHIDKLLDSVNLYFILLARKMTYIKPLRAIAERYYRYQNYSVQEIDADGKNLPMFYNSLSKEAFANLNLWLWKIFRFTLDLRSDGGHIEMLIKEEGSNEARNLTDLGFGYTQVLPILTVLWKVIMVDCINGDDETYDYCKTHIVAIEQPELHLHPRYQGLFADMMAEVIKFCKNEHRDIRIIVETHSEIIINRLGKLIAGKQSGIDKDDVNVVIFNGIKERFNSYVVQTKYDSEGYIKDWPYGFFSDYVDRD